MNWMCFVDPDFGGRLLKTDDFLTRISELDRSSSGVDNKIPAWLEL